MAATVLEIAAVHADFDSGHKALVEREFGTRDARAPAETCLAGFAEPAIERDLFKRGIEGAALGECLCKESGTEDQNEKPADHSTGYSTAAEGLRLMSYSWDLASVRMTRVKSHSNPDTLAANNDKLAGSGTVLTGGTGVPGAMGSIVRIGGATGGVPRCNPLGVSGVVGTLPRLPGTGVIGVGPGRTGTSPKPGGPETAPTKPGG